MTTTSPGTRIGIIGAENSHCQHIARLANKEKRAPAQVVAVWGETEALAQDAAAKCDIPRVVKDWREMLGHVDGVMIDHRHAKHHAAPAQFFLENNIPCFVDKPFTFTTAEARTLLDLAERKKVAVTSFSTIPMEAFFQTFKQEVRAAGAPAHVATLGPGDVHDQYGGVFFYGIHQVEALVELLGPDARRVQVAVRPDGGGVLTVTFASGAEGACTLVKEGFSAFHWTAVAGGKVISATHQRDQVQYLIGLETMVKLFRDGARPFDRQRLFAPVAILAAAHSAIERGGSVEVEKL